MGWADCPVHRTNHTLHPLIEGENHVRRFRTTLTVLIALAVASVLALRLKNKQDDPERGDVPGWVMITMMSAVLVAAILAIAQPALTKMFNDAIALVHQ